MEPAWMPKREDNEIYGSWRARPPNETRVVLQLHPEGFLRPREAMYSSPGPQNAFVVKA